MARQTQSCNPIMFGAANTTQKLWQNKHTVGKNTSLTKRHRPARFWTYVSKISCLAAGYTTCQVKTISDCCQKSQLPAHVTFKPASIVIIQNNGIKQRDTSVIKARLSFSFRKGFIKNRNGASSSIAETD